MRPSHRVSWVLRGKARRGSGGAGPESEPDHGEQGRDGQAGPSPAAFLRTGLSEVGCIVMGSRGSNDLAGMFLGSTSHKVAHRAPCTCIAVK